MFAITNVTPGWLLKPVLGAVVHSLPAEQAGPQTNRGTPGWDWLKTPFPFTFMACIVEQPGVNFTVLFSTAGIVVITDSDPG